MKTPACGSPRFRALFALTLATGFLLLLPTAGAQAAGHNGISSGLLESIQDVVGVLGQAVRHGDRKEVREIDHALEDLIRALEREQKRHHHHHHHHKGGAIHKGMQLGGKDRQSSEQKLTSTGKGPTGKSTGKGKFSKGMGQLSHWQDDGPRHSRFSSESFKQGQEACENNTSTGISKTGETGTGKSGMQTVSSKTPTTTQAAGAAAGNKKTITGTANPTAITKSTAPTSTGVKAATSKTVGNSSAISANNAVAGHKQVANIGKLPSAAPHIAVAAKKPAVTHATPSFANIGHNVGATVGQHRPVAHTAVKKK